VQQLVNGLGLGGTYALLGLGLTLIWGVLGVLTFAQAQVMTWGAFGSLAAISLGAPASVAVLCGVVAGALVCMAIDSVVINPIRRRGGTDFSFVAATMGVAVALSAVLQWLSKSESHVFPQAGFPTGAIHLGEVIVPTLQAVVLLSGLVLGGVLMLVLRLTSFGRQVRAVVLSREVSALLGINVRMVYVLTSAIAGAVTGLAGVFLAVSNANLSYSSGDSLLLVAFAVAVLGGIGSLGGALVGGLLLGVAQVMAVAHLSSAFQQGAAYIAILLVLAVRPQGLFGSREMVRV